MRNERTFIWSKKNIMIICCLFGFDANDYMYEDDTKQCCAGLKSILNHCKKALQLDRCFRLWIDEILVFQSFILASPLSNSFRKTFRWKRILNNNKIDQRRAMNARLPIWILTKPPMRVTTSFAWQLSTGGISKRRNLLSFSYRKEGRAEDRDWNYSTRK